MANIHLLSLLVLKIISEHLLEAAVAVVLDFQSDHLSDRSKLLGYERASAIALSAGEALLIHLGAVALDAGDFLEIDCILLILRRDQ